MANVKKIYEPLYSTKTFGIGLGVTITKQIIEQHGWKMEITGAPREGASVLITIPVVAG
jgi:signal transduction histidine kinase